MLPSTLATWIPGTPDVRPSCTCSIAGVCAQVNRRDDGMTNTELLAAKFWAWKVHDDHSFLTVTPRGNAILECRCTCRKLHSHYVLAYRCCRSGLCFRAQLLQKDCIRRELNTQVKTLEIEAIDFFLHLRCAVPVDSSWFDCHCMSCWYIQQKFVTFQCCCIAVNRNASFFLFWLYVL